MLLEGCFPGGCLLVCWADCLGLLCCLLVGYLGCLVVSVWIFFVWLFCIVVGSRLVGGALWGFGVAVDRWVVASDCVGLIVLFLVFLFLLLCFVLWYLLLT